MRAAKFTIFIIFFLTYMQASFAETSEDYAKARLALASEPDFDGYKLALMEMSTRSEFQKLLSENKVNEAQSKGLALLYIYPLSILGNRIVGETYDWYAKNPKNLTETTSQLNELSRTYITKADLLVKSITNETDCTTIENGCKVININEEEMVLRKLGYVKIRQELLVDIEKKFAFDKITGRNAKGETKEFYFDIWLLTPGNPNSKYNKQPA